MPSFKRRSQEAGLRFPDSKSFVLDALTARIKLPKLGWARLRMRRQVEGTLRNVTVTREGGKWFASVQTELHETITTLDVASTLGIDVGLASFVATSDGQLVAPLRALTKWQRQLKHRHRTVSRKEKNSSNHRKAARHLGNPHRRIARQRSDWQHKLTTRLASEHTVIALEDLSIKNMSASARGTADAPGRNVRSKAGPNQSILDAA